METTRLCGVDAAAETGAAVPRERGVVGVGVVAARRSADVVI